MSCFGRKRNWKKARQGERNAVSALHFQALFRMCMAFVLCMGLAVPSTALSKIEAYADENDGGLIDLTVSPGSEEGVVELAVGDEATISVNPYQYVCKPGADTIAFGCDENTPSDLKPVICSASVTAVSSDSAIVAANDVISDEELVASRETLGATNSGTVVLVALEVGEATITVDAHNPWSDTTASATYTVRVSEEVPASDVGLRSADPVQNSDGAYELDSASDLSWFAEKVNSGDVSASAVLTSDILLDDGVLPAIASNAGIDRAFSGVFDGNGHTISGIAKLTKGTSALANESSGGFVTNLNGGTIRNLTLEGAVKESSMRVGVFAAFSYKGTIENCANKVNVTASGTLPTGGFIGTIGNLIEDSAFAGDTAIVSCLNEADLSTNWYVGGFIGEASRTAKASLAECGNTGNITGGINGNAGGLVGYSSTTLAFSGCFNKGEIKSAGDAVGGLIGVDHKAYTEALTIVDCYNAGLVTGNADGTASSPKAGGLVGYSWNTRSFSTCTITNSYNAGVVTISGSPADPSSGSIAGYVYRDDTLTLDNVYYLEGTSENATSGNGAVVGAATVVTQDGLRVLASSLGESFVNQVDGYPLLLWEANGSTDDPVQNADGAYELSSTSDLSWFSNKVNGGDVSAHAILTADIVLDDATLPTFGSESSPFVGTFDGGGHAISGISSFSSASAPALVGCLGSGGVIANLRLEGSVSGLLANAASFVNVSSGGTVEGCVNGLSIETSGNVGGIVCTDSARNSAQTIISSCMNMADLKGGEYAGGIVATMPFFGGNLLISLCGNTGSVAACADGGAVTGGILARATQRAAVSITFCSNRGAVSAVSDRADASAGGIVGADARGAVISGSYSDGTITASAGPSYSASAGGIIGLANTSTHATNVFSFGLVSAPIGGTTYAGGLVGNAVGGDDASPVFSNAYYLDSSCPQSVGYGGFAGGSSILSKTAAEFEVLAAFLSDSFVDDACGHPILTWEPATVAPTHAITYHLDGGVNAAANPSTYETGTVVPLADPTKDGYVFGGWYSDASFQNRVTEIPSGATGDIVLFAKWANLVGLGITVEMDEGYEYIATNMGRNPAAEVSFKFKPSDDALKAYRDDNPGASMGKMMQAWIAGIQSVSIDGTPLTAKVLADWKSEMTDPVSDHGKLNYYWLNALTSYSSFSVPIAVFDTTQSERDTKTVTIDSTGFESVNVDVTYRNIGAQTLVVRILDKSAEEGGTVQYSRTFTMDDLKDMDTQSGVGTSANCGMAGLRSYKAEGVYLTDILDAAGVTFSSGMTLRLRTTDYATTNNGDNDREAAYIDGGDFSYDELMGVARYHYPAMWDDVTAYDELGGRTIYSILSTDMNSWKSAAGDKTQAANLEKLLGDSKIKLESPLIAWVWNEGVVAWGGTDPDAQTWATGDYNAYTSHETFRFLYGMAANEDGTIKDEFTTSTNAYGVFGIDIVDAGYHPTSYAITYHLDGGVNAAINPLTYETGTVVPLADPTKDGYVFGGWYSDASFQNRVTEIPSGATGDIVLFAKWDKVEETGRDPSEINNGVGSTMLEDQSQQMSGSGDGTSLVQTGDNLSTALIMIIIIMSAVIVSVFAATFRSLLSKRLDGRG